MSHANRAPVRMTGTTERLRTVGSSSSLIMIHRHTARLIVYRSFTSSLFSPSTFLLSSMRPRMHTYVSPVAFSSVFFLFGCYFTARFLLRFDSCLFCFSRLFSQLYSPIPMSPILLHAVDSDARSTQIHRLRSAYVIWHIFFSIFCLIFA